MEETAHSASTVAGTAAETAAPRSHSLCQTHARAMASGIDENTLREVASRTGGQFFRARDTQSLAGIYAEIDKLEPVKREGPAVRPRIEQYWRWLLYAGIVAMLAVVWRALRSRTR